MIERDNGDHADDGIFALQGLCQVGEIVVGLDDFDTFGEGGCRGGSDNSGDFEVGVDEGGDSNLS